MRRRYKNTNWPRVCNGRVAQLKNMLRVNAPRIILAESALNFLQAHYGGPWRMVAAVIKWQLRWFFGWYLQDQWEWVRVHVLRQPPDEFLVEAKRDQAEQKAVERLNVSR